MIGLLLFATASLVYLFAWAVFYAVLLRSYELENGSEPSFGLMLLAMFSASLWWLAPAIALGQRLADQRVTKRFRKTKAYRIPVVGNA